MNWKMLLTVATMAAVWGIVPVAYGETFTDSRDGQKYKAVEIGGKTWMAENLNYKIGNSWCYDNDDTNCAKYGILYSWDAAMKACPAGWRLPSNNEWDDLVAVAGGSGTAGTKLKSATGWKQDSNTPTGTDDFGFSALPCGPHYSDGSWWTATEKGAGRVYIRSIHHDSLCVCMDDDDGKGGGNSVRCIKNN